MSSRAGGLIFPLPLLGEVKGESPHVQFNLWSPDLGGTAGQACEEEKEIDVPPATSWPRDSSGSVS